MPQILHPALRQVDVRLQSDTRGRRGMAHQLGVRGLLAADHDGRHAAGLQCVDAVLPGAVAAEDADHGDVGAAEQFGEFAVDQP